MRNLNVKNVQTHSSVGQDGLWVRLVFEGDELPDGDEWLEVRVKPTMDGENPTIEFVYTIQEAFDEPSEEILFSKTTKEIDQMLEEKYSS